MTGYELSKAWFKWCKANRPLINPNHHALYFWIIEKANSLDWCPSFGLPSDDAMHHLGISSYKTYIKAFDDLERFGFIKVVERSKNQYTCNIIALVEFTEAKTKAPTKASDKADTKAQDKASPKQSEYNKTLKLINFKTLKPFVVKPTEEKKDEYIEEQKQQQQQGFDLAGQERLENPITPYQKSLLTIEETKERFLNDNGVFEIFVRATKLERVNYEKAIEIFINHTSKKIKYPRLYDTGKDNSENHFLNWYVYRKLEEFAIVPIPEKPKPIPILTDEERKALNERNKQREKDYLESMKKVKIEMDKNNPLNHAKVRLPNYISA